MSDEINDEIADLRALEQQFAGKVAAVRRRKALLKRQLLESGAEQRLITDHALVRYLERHKGIDINAIRDELRGIADASIPAKGGEHHWHPSGVMLIIGEEGQVITVLSPEQAEKHSGRKLANGERVPSSTPSGE